MLFAPEDDSYTIEYKGVKFLVHETRLQGSLKDAFNADNDVLVIRDFEYVSVIPDNNDGVDEKEFEYAPQQYQQQQQQQQPDDDEDDEEKKQHDTLGKRFLLKTDNKADATDMLLLLATMYWHDRPEQLFFDRSHLTLIPHKDIEGVIEPNKYDAVHAHFKPVSVYTPAPWSTSQPFFSWWYAGIALIYRFECHGMLANVFRFVGERFSRLRIRGLASTIIVCLWLAETYGGTQHSGTAAKLRDELKRMPNVADCIHLLPSAVISKEIYHWSLQRWVARSQSAHQKLKAHRLVLAGYVEEVEVLKKRKVQR